jgi:hypothetical protein
MIHELKIGKPYFEAIVDGRKTFELRYNDRGYNTGDIIKFTVMDGIYDCTYNYTKNNICINYKITYLISGSWLKENFVAFSIVPVKEHNHDNQTDSEAKQEREEVARELDKVVNWAQEYTADAAVRDADLLHIADYCIKFRNDGIKQAVERIEHWVEVEKQIAIDKYELNRVVDYCNSILKELEGKC